MSSITSYKTTAFKESQKFLVIDPSTQSPSLVLGSDLVSYITPMLNYVRADSTRLAAENTDYDVGTLVQTSGATSPGDNFAATYLVVEGGSGDFPMLNGNDLLVIKGDEFLREQLISSDAGEGSDLVAHTGTSDTVTEALDKRVIRKTSIAEIEALTGVSDYQVSLSGLRAGIFEFDSSDLSAEVSADTLQGIYIAPNSDATGASGAWVRQDEGPVQLTWFGADNTGATDASSIIESVINSGYSDIVGYGDYLISNTVVVEASDFNLFIENYTTTSAITCFQIGVNNQGVDNTDPANKRVLNIKVEAKGSGVAGSTAFAVHNAQNCELDFRFEDFETGLLLFPRESPDFSRSGRLMIDLNTVNVDYPLFAPSPTNQAIRYKSFGDITLRSAELQAARRNINLNQVDGVVIGDVTLYQNPAVLTNRFENLRLRECVWVNIHNLQCFEAGSIGIDILGCTGVNIMNANVIWPGEITIAPGIRLKEDSVSGLNTTQFNIGNVMVDRGSGQGIVIQNAKRGVVNGTVWACSNPFKNASATIGARDGVQIENSEDITGSISSTSSGQHRYDLNAITGNSRLSFVLAAFGAATASINIDKANVTVLLNQGWEVAKKAIFNSGLTSLGQFTSSGPMTINGSVSDTVDNIPDGATTFDSSSSSLLFTGNTSSTTFTNLTSPLIGQRVSMIARDANTTLSHQAGGAGQLFLKGGVNRLLDLNEVVNFRYVGAISSWVEE